MADAILDRLVEIGEEQSALLDYLREHPNLHPDESRAKFAAYDALENEYLRLKRRDHGRKVRR